MPYARAGKHKLHYEVIDVTAPWVSDPETIVFHHGVGSESGMWNEWISVLGSRYRIVTFDFRGFGRSSQAGRGFKWTLDNVVADLAAVADAAGARRFHLVGESMGGTIALCFALAHPQRVKSVTVSNGAHIGSSIEHVSHWKRVLDRQGAAGWSRGMMADRFFPGALAEDKRRWFSRQQAKCRPDSVLNALSLLVGIDIKDRLGRIRVPALLLHPDHSPFIPVEVMADLHRRLPAAQMKVFPNSRHGLPFSHARECAQTLRDFLESPR